MNPDMGDGAGMKDNILKLKSLFLGMERYLTHGIVDAKSSGQKLGKDGEASHPGEFIFDIFWTG